MTENLHPSHLADLKKSGLSDETILQAGVKTVPPNQINKKLGLSIPDLTSCYEMPYGDNFSRFKAFYDNGGNKKNPKYLQPKDTGNRLYIPPQVRPILNDISVPLYVTEGEKKSLKACQEGLCCIGLSGLWNWSNGNKELISDFNRIVLKGRTVYIVPDNDWLRPNKHGYKKNLEKAVTELSCRLMERGAKVHVIKLPTTEKGKVGLDDFLLNHSVEDFKALPVTEINLSQTRLELKKEPWPDPVPFDDYSLLPDFPTEALSGIGKDMVEAVSEVNQVDPALTACVYLADLSSCCSRKARIDLISHTEPLNLYLCPVYDSGNRKSSTVSDMVRPLYEFEKARQEEMKTTIWDAENTFKIKERRLERLQKKAAEADNQEQRQQFESEAAELARDMAENTVPKNPVFLIDDVTPEKLGVLMAENRERITAIHPEGNLFEIMAGRYSKDGIGNIDLFLKAHAGDFWGNHRIGREAKTMQAPALTLCLAVQSEVIEEAGKNKHFRGKGLLARFLYARCKSQVGYRKRQTTSISFSVTQGYKDHIFSLMEIPFTEGNLKLSPEAQRLWDEFYGDIEKEMRPGESLQYLTDWGSKLPGAVARIAGLLHFSEHGAKGLSLPVSVTSVSASSVIGAYFKEHAIAVFGLMQEDRRIKLARQILSYIRRARPEIFKGRDVMHHTSISLMDEVEQGLKVLVDRAYIREESTYKEKSMGRPKAQAYRVHPAIVSGKYV